jgi:alpha-1,3-rhamnosyl/mannosyltransferase
VNAGRPRLQGTSEQPYLAYRPLKIVIDATSTLLPSAGVKNYVYWWVQALLRRAPPGTISVYPFLHNLGELDHLRPSTGRGAWLRRMFVNLANIRGNPMVDMLYSGAGVFHASQHLANPPRRPALTATVFDMTCWLLPETHTPENVEATKRYAERILRRADGLIAISESTRRDACEILKLPADRIEVIYPGIADHFFDVSDGAAEAARLKYRLDRPYLLHIGMLEPRKNIGRLLDAYNLLPESVRSDCKLVLAGPFGWRSERLAERLNSQPGARVLGYVPEADLSGLLKGAHALIYPSLYEGFGFPLAQAMAAGVPAIASNVSSLPEIAGDAALLVDPLNAGELSAAIERVLVSSDTRARLSASGPSRARKFNWNQCADQSLRFFDRHG